MYLNKILLTTDFSDSSYLAFGLAQHEARLSKSEITLLNVFEVPPMAIGFDGYVPPPELTEKVKDEALVEARRKLDELATKHFTHEKLSLVALPSWHSAGYLIADYAAANHFGLVVIASQGKGAFGRIFLGSTAERVIRMARCPVLVVPGGQKQTSAPIGPYKNILVTTDFSADSVQAFRFAAYEAKLNSAKVFLGHVVQHSIAPELLHTERADLTRDYEKIQREYLQSLDLRLKDYAKQHFPTASVTPVMIDKTYSVANAVAEFIKQNGCDLLVLSTHGAGPQFNLIGGVAERILRQVNCPVLVVPKADRKLTENHA